MRDLTNTFCRLCHFASSTHAATDSFAAILDPHRVLTPHQLQALPTACRKHGTNVTRMVKVKHAYM